MPMTFWCVFFILFKKTLLILVNRSKMITFDLNLCKKKLSSFDESKIFESIDL